ncbi:hypothetical protein DU475_00495 [Rhodopseudomonas sp. WA056]|nr:hypothetical protein [Rhodopseudomonas sp. WA056]
MNAAAAVLPWSVPADGAGLSAFRLQLSRRARIGWGRGDDESAFRLRKGGDDVRPLTKIKLPIADWNSLNLHVFLLLQRVQLTIRKL